MQHRLTILNVLDRDVKEWQAQLNAYRRKDKRKRKGAVHPGNKPPQRDPDKGRAITQMKRMMSNIDKHAESVQYWEWVCSTRPTPENEARLESERLQFQQAVTLFNRFAMEHKMRFV